MKDKLVAAVEVSLFVAILLAIAPRGKGPAPKIPAQYASFVPFAASAEAPAQAARAPAKPVAVAAAAKPAVAPAAQPRPGAKQLWGTVDSIDASAHALAIKDKRGRIHTVALPADAQVTVGGENKAAAVSDVKAGDAVMVTAEKDTARQIHVRLLFPAPGLASAN